MTFKDWNCALIYYGTLLEPATSLKSELPCTVSKVICLTLIKNTGCRNTIAKPCSLFLNYTYIYPIYLFLSLRHEAESNQTWVVCCLGHQTQLKMRSVCKLCWFTHRNYVATHYSSSLGGTHLEKIHFKLFTDTKHSNN